MSLAEFILPVFCWVEACLKSITGGVPLRAGRVAPRWSDREALTLEIVGEGLGYDGDTAIGSSVKRHWAVWFPGRGERSRCVRPAAKRWPIKRLLHER